MTDKPLDIEAIRAQSRVLRGCHATIAADAIDNLCDALEASQAEARAASAFAVCEAKEAQELRDAIDYHCPACAGSHEDKLAELVRQRDEANGKLNAAVAAAVYEAVLDALAGNPVSDFMLSVQPVAHAQSIGEQMRLLEADNAAMWKAIKDTCEILRVTEDDEGDWPKLPTYAIALKAERDEARRERDEALQDIDTLTTEYAGAAFVIDGLVRERDEAIAELRKWYDPLEHSGPDEKTEAILRRHGGSEP